MSDHFSVSSVSPILRTRKRSSGKKIRCDWLVEDSIIKHLCVGVREMLSFLDD